MGWVIGLETEGEGGGRAEVDVDVDGIVEAGGAGAASAVDVVWPVNVDDMVRSRTFAAACRMGEELGVAGVGDGVAAALRSASCAWG